MPLRYLIIAIDPESKTSPIPILKRWKDSKLMSVYIWDDSKFMPSKIRGNVQQYGNNTELLKHRVRQNNFYFKCMKTFKQRGREWLMLIDTDEYIVTNYGSGLLKNLTEKLPITEPGNVLRFIKFYQQVMQIQQQQQPLQPQEESFNNETETSDVAVADDMKDTGNNNSSSEVTTPTTNQSACIYMPRFMFGTKESSKEIVQRFVPYSKTGLNASNFMTQRWIFRNPRRMHNGKNLIHLQLLPEIKQYTSVHHVSSYCPDPDSMRLVNHVRNALVRVHHYLGTQEQYFFRDDPRILEGRTRTNTTNTTHQGEDPMAHVDKHPKTYHARSLNRYMSLDKKSTFPDPVARAWIKGFLQTMGIEKAQSLLKGVGEVGIE